MIDPDSRFVHDGVRAGPRGLRATAVILMSWAVLLSWAAVLAPTAHASAQPSSGDPPFTRALPPEQQAIIDEMAEAIAERSRINLEFLRLEGEFVEAFNDGDLSECEAILGKQIALKPAAFTSFYNLACVKALSGESAAAVESLVIALERGFDDVHQLERDPHLDSIRGEPMFANIVRAWPAILDRQRDANLAAASKFYADGYIDTVIDDLRIVVRSAYDERTTADAITDVRRVVSWADAELFNHDGDRVARSPADDEDAHALHEEQEQLSRARTPWVLVILPNDRDFTRWQVQEFGPMAVRGISAVGGLYDHDRKRLVVRDLGATLRHEMMHVLHWRHMGELGQRHPIWIQEGLGALVEDLDPPGALVEIEKSTAAAPLPEDGLWQPVVSWRTNTTRRMAEINALTPIHRLAAMTPIEFSQQRPLASYAQVRSWMLWLHERGVLGEWYAAVCDGFAADPTGQHALLAVEHEASADMEVQPDDLLDARRAAAAMRGTMGRFRAWARALPVVPERGSELSIALGLDAEGGSGDGPVITRVRSAANRRESGIRAGDVLQSINGRPVRDLQELIRVLGAYEPGDQAALGLRRGTQHRVETVRLAPG